jgi:hypothetical protein
MVNISPERPQKTSEITDLGPGRYDAGKNFGEDVKSFEFGQKREPKVVETPGPGHYQPKEEMTKDKVTGVLIAPERPSDHPAPVSDPIGPGAY